MDALTRTRLRRLTARVTKLEAQLDALAGPLSRAQVATIAADLMARLGADQAGSLAAPRSSRGP